MYPYPYPYPYPAYPMPAYRPAPPRTPEGIKWSLVGLFLALGYFLAQMLVAALLVNALANFNAGASITEFITAIAWLLIAAVLTGILGILTLVFYFIGFGYMYGGRNEFGPSHARNLRVSLVLSIVAMSLGLVGYLVTWIANAGVYRIGFGTIEINAGALYLGVAVSVVMGITVSALAAAHLVLVIRSVVRPERQVVLMTAAALGTATPGIAGALQILQIPHVIEVLQAWADSLGGGGFFFAAPPIDATFGVPSLVSAALSAVVMLIFILLFREVGASIRTGALKPVLPTPAPAPSWMPGPVAPPMYPTYPPAYPPQPPPQSPPGAQGPGP
jgi:hypothetical protein